MQLMVFMPLAPVQVDRKVTGFIVTQTPFRNIQLMLFLPLASAQVDMKVAREEVIFVMQTPL